MKSQNFDFSLWFALLSPLLGILLGMATFFQINKQMNAIAKPNKTPSKPNPANLVPGTTALARPNARSQHVDLQSGDWLGSNL